jgi:formylglycine-generating enzyme required for sulfatase activity
MAEIKPIQIFLCHASEDKVAVEAIYDRLKSLGYKPWLDKRDLLPGQRWRVEIPKAIRASDYILIFLSETSVAKRGYVQDEFKLALEVLRQIPDGTIYAIPVRLDECPIPDQFADLHWCNLFEADGFEYLLRALHAGRPSPERAAAAPQLPSLGGAIPVQLTKDVALTRHPFEPEMILVPAGEFLMGSDPQQDEDAFDHEQPQHRLFLPDYLLAKTLVTQAQYREFVRATGHEAPHGWTNGDPPPDKADHPVVYVSWYDARDYCQWLSQVTGKDYRLPNEAEWEKGARSIDARIYPWGNQWDATRCNSYESRLGKTTPVGAYPQGASPYGLLDMAGNVVEWTRSLWGKNKENPDYRYPYRPTDGRENTDAGREEFRVWRGGAFDDALRLVRCAARGRFDPYYGYFSIGFRVGVLPAV